MKIYLAKRRMSRFQTFEELASWLSSYGVLNKYRNHVEGCWNSYESYVPEAHTLDYFMVISINLAGTRSLKITRVTKPIEEIL